MGKPTAWHVSVKSVLSNGMATAGGLLVKIGAAKRKEKLGSFDLGTWPVLLVKNRTRANKAGLSLRILTKLTTLFWNLSNPHCETSFYNQL